MNAHNFGPADAGPLVRFGDAMTARTILAAGATSGGFAVVEHLLAPKELAAPLHMHSREDEFTVVMKGRIGFLLGEEVFHAGPGQLVRKPRGQWHTFWNAGDEPAQVLEVISPAGFEEYFQEIGPFFPDDAAPDLEGMAAANAKYGLRMDFESLPKLINRFGLIRPLEMDGEAPT
ncbi:cupin domain-containing protein [Arthrobacter sp. SAFR-014]|uniref:cupin domain-containing protein n=1 Tax=unclassified Arthrobacter TaxID=235627 RepID=UPI003F7C5D94